MNVAKAMEDAVVTTGGESTEIASDDGKKEVVVSEIEETNNNSATVTKEDGQPAHVENNGSKSNGSDDSSSTDSTKNTNKAGEIAAAMLGACGTVMTTGWGYATSGASTTWEFTKKQLKPVTDPLKKHVTTPVYNFFTKEDGYAQKAYETLSKHQILCGVVIGAITGITLYKIVNNIIDNNALKNLSDEEKQDIALAGLISRRDQLQQEITDLEVVIAKRGFATATEDACLAELKAERAENEGYIISVLRSKKSVADLVSLLFTLDA